MTFVAQHLMYWLLNGNLMWPLLLAYAINYPYFKWTAKISWQENNFDRKAEKIFKEDKRFMGPVYMFVAFDCLTWVWCLATVSGFTSSWLPEGLFEDKITHTYSGFVLFTFVWGYMAGVNGLAGHELIHKREAYNKGLGMFTYSKILYSHFLLEHSSGHHRNIATPEDSATARLSENFYSFAVRSAVGGHVNTWEREVSRLQSKYNSN